MGLGSRALCALLAAILCFWPAVGRAGAGACPSVVAPASSVQDWRYLTAVRGLDTFSSPVDSLKLLASLGRAEATAEVARRARGWLESQGEDLPDDLVRAMLDVSRCTAASESDAAPVIELLLARESPPEAAWRAVVRYPDLFAAREDTIVQLVLDGHLDPEILAPARIDAPDHVDALLKFVLGARSEDTEDLAWLSKLEGTARSRAASLVARAGSQDPWPRMLPEAILRLDVATLIPQLTAGLDHLGSMEDIPATKIWTASMLLRGHPERLAQLDATCVPALLRRMDALDTLAGDPDALIAKAAAQRRDETAAFVAQLAIAGEAGSLRRVEAWSPKLEPWQRSALVEAMIGSLPVKSQVQGRGLEGVNPEVARRVVAILSADIQPCREFTRNIPADTNPAAGAVIDGQLSAIERCPDGERYRLGALSNYSDQLDLEQCERIARIVTTRAPSSAVNPWGMSERGDAADILGRCLAKGLPQRDLEGSLWVVLSAESWLESEGCTPRALAGVLGVLTGSPEVRSDTLERDLARRCGPEQIDLASRAKISQIVTDAARGGRLSGLLPLLGPDPPVAWGDVLGARCGDASRVFSVWFATGGDEDVTRLADTLKCDHHGGEPVLPRLSGREARERLRVLARATQGATNPGAQERLARRTREALEQSAWSAGDRDFLATQCAALDPLGFAADAAAACRRVAGLADWRGRLWWAGALLAGLLAAVAWPAWLPPLWPGSGRIILDREPGWLRDGWATWYRTALRRSRRARRVALAVLRARLPTPAPPEVWVPRVVLRGQESLDATWGALPRRALIQAQSGMGKSDLLRWLASHPPEDGVVILLDARACGVDLLGHLSGRAPRLPVALWAPLLDSGQVLLLVDAVNDASPVARAALGQLLREHPGWSILMTAQPLALDREELPTDVALLSLRPALQRERETYLDAHAQRGELTGARWEAYAALRARCLAAMDGPDPASPADLQPLSCPLDLADLAWLLTQGELPDLARLRARGLERAAAAYEARTGRAFPHALVAETALRWLREEGPQARISLEDPALVEVLEGERVVVRRETARDHSELLFRHVAIASAACLSLFLPVSGGRRRWTSEALAHPRLVELWRQVACTLPEAELRELDHWARGEARAGRPVREAARVIEAVLYDRIPQSSAPEPPPAP